MIIHSPSVSRCSSAMTVHEVPLLITKGYQATQKGESVRHVLVLRGISQFAMKAFLQLKRPSGQNREGIGHCSSSSPLHPSRGRVEGQDLNCHLAAPLSSRSAGGMAADRQIRNNGSASFRRRRRRGRFCVSSPARSPGSSPLFEAAIRASFIWNEMSFLVIVAGEEEGEGGIPCRSPAAPVAI